MLTDPEATEAMPANDVVVALKAQDKVKGKFENEETRKDDLESLFRLVEGGEGVENQLEKW